MVYDKKEVIQHIVHRAIARAKTREPGSISGDPKFAFQRQFKSIKRLQYDIKKYKRIVKKHQDLPSKTTIQMPYTYGIPKGWFQVLKPGFSLPLPAGITTEKKQLTAADIIKGIGGIKQPGKKPMPGKWSPGYEHPYIEWFKQTPEDSGLVVTPHPIFKDVYEFGEDVPEDVREEWEQPDVNIPGVPPIEPPPLPEWPQITWPDFGQIGKFVLIGLGAIILIKILGARKK